MFFPSPKKINAKMFNWRASEASETLFSHVYGNSRYISESAVALSM